MIVRSAQFDGISFVGRSKQPVRELSGFDKQRHKLPQHADQYGNKFVGSLASLELEQDLEAVFQNLRNVFKLKRKELERSSPVPGCGSIETPHFTYSLNLRLLEENPAISVWERSVNQIKTPDQILTPEFAQSFEGKFDRIEFAFDQRISLEDFVDHLEEMDDERLDLKYDSQLTGCQIRIIGINATIEVSDCVVAVVHHRLASTSEILSSFLEVKKSIVDSFSPPI